MSRLGLGYEDIAAVHPAVVYLSVSGFGNRPDEHGNPSPYDSWPAFAPIVEAMSGIYEFKREGDAPPVAAPVGALGDIGSGALRRDRRARRAAPPRRHRPGPARRHRDARRHGGDDRHRHRTSGRSACGAANLGPLIMHGFRAGDGWFIVQVGREPQFAALADLVGEPGWVDDPRFAERQGWVDHLEDVIRPAVEGWAAGRTRLEACEALSAAGIAAGPCFTDDEVVADPHVAARNMLVEMPRTDGVDQPVLVPGNPVKLSDVAEGPETRVPWLGEHTDEVLAAELGLSEAELASLRTEGVIA